MTKSNRGIVTSHFIAFFGVPTEIRPRAVRGIGEVAILEFAPAGNRKTWRYATNGMSAYLQRHPDPRVHVRTEVYATTCHRQGWVDDLLLAVAAYPYDCDTYLAEGDSVNVGQPIDRRVSPYTGILLIPPGPHDASNLGLVGGVVENILVHQVVGLLPSEVELAAQGNGKRLSDAIRAADELSLDAHRAKIVW